MEAVPQPWSASKTQSLAEELELSGHAPGETVNRRCEMYSCQNPIIAEIIKTSAELQPLSKKKGTVKNAKTQRCYLTAAWFHTATYEEGLRTSWNFFLLFSTDGRVAECCKIYRMYDFLEFSI